MVLRSRIRLKKCLGWLTVMCMCGTIVYFTLTTQTPKRRISLCGKPKTHVFFLRVPKTGTSTSTFIFWRYGIRHNVSVLLPKPNKEETYRGIEYGLHEVDSPPYSITANQLVYNPVNFARFLPKDTVYIAQLRHPFAHLTSVINYKGHDYQKRLPDGDRVREYLRDPRGYELKWHEGVSLTNNPFAFYFGVDKRFLRNPITIKSIISKIDKAFAAVLILERLDESLIMMKRVLCWSFEDIIYRVENVNDAKSHAAQDKELQSKHERWAVTDFKLYNHFAKKLQNYVLIGGSDFQLEVSEFKSVLTDIHAFCESSDRKPGSYIYLPGGAFYDAFTYTSGNCTLLSTSSVDLRNIIRRRQGLPLE